ncbi:MAG: hypothetical protein IKB61_02115, partial [Elusimicrobiaceae bacterium]|nr:hypothetical protein [Elusimicrobiaceae bacterium]
LTEEEKSAAKSWLGIEEGSSVPDNVYTKTNLLGGKDIEIVPEPAVVVAYSYVPYTSGYGYGPFPELLYSSASSIEQGVTTNYYTDVELTNLYGSTSGYTNANGRLVIRSGSTAKCEMRLLDGTPVVKSTGNMVINSLLTKTSQLENDSGFIAPTVIAGYDSTKTQVLKHINGVLQWVEEA